MKKGEAEMSEFQKFFEEQLEDPEVKAEYDALEPEFNIIRTMIEEQQKDFIPENQK